MNPHETRPEFVCGDRSLSLSEIAEQLPELNRSAIVASPLSSWGLIHETILSMEWTGIPGGGSTVTIETIELPDGRYAFFQFGALDLDDQRAEPNTLKLIAASTIGSTSGARDAFLEELLRSNGEVFGIALMSSAPSSMSCVYNGNRDVLVDAFVECLEVASQWGVEPFESLEQHVELETDEDDEYVLKASVAAYLNQMLGPE